jgi:hypothetical protein
MGSMARRVTGALVVSGGFAIAQVQDLPGNGAWVNVVPAAHAADTKKSVFVGDYTDPNHPDGMRHIDVKGTDVTLTGTDSAGGKQWVLKAKESEGTIFVDFSPKGGPPNLLGVFENDSIRWPDGNRWAKKQS